MQWLEHLVRTVRPSMGGVLSVSDDADGLLKLPAVRECLVTAGMRVLEWDGSDAMLWPLRAIDPDDRPLLVAPASPQRHRIESLLPHAIERPLDLSLVVPRLDRSVVRAVPSEMWDIAHELSARQPRTLPPRETAELLARVLYRVDTEHLRARGWWSTLIGRAASAEVMPEALARAVVQSVPAGTLPFGVDATVAALVDPSIAAVRVAEHFRDHPDLAGLLGEGEIQLVHAWRTSGASRREAIATTRDWVAEWPGADASPADLLAFGSAYVVAAGRDDLPDGVRKSIEDATEAWMVANYDLAARTPSSAAPFLHGVVPALHEAADHQRLLLLVIDGLGLDAWDAVAEAWATAGVFSRHDTRAVFASLPTITEVSRLSLFEGSLCPRGWGKTLAVAERAAWAGRFTDLDPRCALHGMDSPDLLDAICQGVPRLAALDSSWDGALHGLAPGFQDLRQTAGQWAANCAERIGSLVQEAFENRYRVFLTADHGAVAATGTGAIQKKGVLAPKRSKRVLLFESEAICRSYAAHGVAFAPPTGPAGIWPLFARTGSSFDNRGARSYSHGGLSLQEVLVPLAELQR